MGREEGRPRGGWRWALAALAVAVAILGAARLLHAPGPPVSPPAGREVAPPAGGAASGDAGPSRGGLVRETVATGLEVVWDLAFDREGNLFLTERPGRIRLLPRGRAGPPLTVATLPDTAAVGEGGLLGLALHPGFPDPPWVYVYQTHRRGRGLANRVLRLRMDEEGRRLVGPEVVFDGIPGAATHNGGQLEFGPDGMLYVTTGDAGRPERAQDRDTLHGKILRLQPDGTPPPDNPFGRHPVYSYGHRNPQGLAFDPATGVLYAVEHGPDAWDELNRVEPGGNYGWPRATGPDHGPYVAPLRAYRPVVAPAGADFYVGPIRGWHGSLFFGTLGFAPDSAGRHLHRVRLGPDGRSVVEEEVLLRGEYGRIRAVRTGPDGCLYLGTSNRDGRGEPRPGDDRIVRLCAGS